MSISQYMSVSYIHTACDAPKLLQVRAVFIATTPHGCKRHGEWQFYLGTIVTSMENMGSKISGSQNYGIPSKWILHFQLEYCFGDTVDLKSTCLVSVSVSQHGDPSISWITRINSWTLPKQINLKYLSCGPWHLKWKKIFKITQKIKNPNFFKINLQWFLRNFEDTGGFQRFLIESLHNFHIHQGVQGTESSLLPSRSPFHRLSSSPESPFWLLEPKILPKREIF